MLLARPTSPNGRRCTRRARPRCCQATRPRFRGCRCPATTRPLGDGINRDPMEQTAFETLRLRSRGFEGGIKGILNLYLMVENDAVNRLDPLGLEGIDPWGEWIPPLEKCHPKIVKDCATACALAHLPMRATCLLGCAGAGPGYLACVSPCMAAATLSQALCTAICLLGNLPAE